MTEGAANRGEGGHQECGGQAPSGTEDRGAQGKREMGCRCTHTEGSRTGRSPGFGSWEMRGAHASGLRGGRSCAGLGRVCTEAPQLGLGQGERGRSCGGCLGQGPERRCADSVGHVVLSQTFV